jgi:hypothetical protein
LVGISRKAARKAEEKVGEALCEVVDCERHSMLLNVQEE